MVVPQNVTVLLEIRASRKNITTLTHLYVLECDQRRLLLFIAPLPLMMVAVCVREVDCRQVFSLYHLIKVGRTSNSSFVGYVTGFFFQDVNETLNKSDRRREQFQALTCEM